MQINASVLTEIRSMSSRRRGKKAHITALSTKKRTHVSSTQWLGENDMDEILQPYADNTRRKIFKMVLRASPKSVILVSSDSDSDLVAAEPQQRGPTHGNIGLLNNGEIRKPMRKALESGKTKLLIPFLTPGHWVGIFVHAKQKQASAFEYFDSLARAPSSEVYHFFHTLNSFLQELGYRPAPDLIHWPVCIQESASECGMFVLWFLTRRASNESLQSLVDNPPSDEDCQEMRKQFFTVSSKRESDAPAAPSSSDVEVVDGSPAAPSSDVVVLDDDSEVEIIEIENSGEKHARKRPTKKRAVTRTKRR